MAYRIGIDLGGTKTEAAALGPDGAIIWRQRVSTPPTYEASVANMAALTQAAERAIGARASVGVGIPGTLSPASGVIKNANTQTLNGRALDADLGLALEREIRVENDANCFALSEAVDGAGQGRRCVFGVILGTGCGGGIVVERRVLEGRNRVAGEWGHTPLPWPGPDEYPEPPCWCGQRGCLELYLAGPGLARTCDAPDAVAVLQRAEAGDAAAIRSLDRHADRLARGLAVVINVLDPDVIVLGGGLSNMAHLYRQAPERLRRYVFSDTIDTPILRNRHGDSGGVRGAAWLWPAER